MLVSIVIVVHFLWIVFLALGFVFVLRRSRVAYVHATGLLISLVLNLFSWYCPLTHLEGYLHRMNAPGAVHQDPFLVRVLERVVYPDLPEGLIRAAEIGFVLLNAAGYGWVLGRGYFRRRGASQGCGVIRADGGHAGAHLHSHPGDR